jgi:hypothetical protein
MSDTEQAPEIVEAPPKKPRGRPKGQCSEKQLAALRIGIENLKKKRELIAQRKADGTYDPTDPAVMAKPKIISIPKKRGAKPMPQQIIEVPRKERDPLVKQADLAQLRDELATLRAHIEPKVVEKIVEKPVEKIVEKSVERIVEKRLTGRELLDNIFFKN